MPKIFTSRTQRIGELGEEIAAMFLVKRGYKIIERNYTKKWGEIDIVAKRFGRVHFIEVKAKSFDLSDPERTERFARPEENVHPKKIERLKRAIQTYLAERKVSKDIPWQVDIMAVFLDKDSKKAKVRTMANVII